MYRPSLYPRILANQYEFIDHLSGLEMDSNAGLEGNAIRI